MGSSSSTPSHKTGLFPSKPGDSVSLIITFEGSHEKNDDPELPHAAIIEFLRNQKSLFNRTVLKWLPDKACQLINEYTSDDNHFHDLFYNFRVHIKPSDITKVKMSKIRCNDRKCTRTYKVFITTTLQPREESVKTYMIIRGKTVMKDKSNSLQDYFNDIQIQLDHHNPNVEFFDDDDTIYNMPTLIYSHFEYAPAHCFVRADGRGK